MPGKKDFITVKQGDGHVHVQKRLFLSDLREICQRHKEQFPNEKVGFSKFAELRPKHCVWLELVVPTQFVFVSFIRMLN